MEKVNVYLEVKCIYVVSLVYTSICDRIYDGPNLYGPTPPLVKFNFTPTPATTKL